MSLFDKTYKKEIYEKEYTIYSKGAVWKLKQIIKALSCGVGFLCNDENDWARLDACNDILKKETIK